jgi:hypothetical protein
MIDRNLNPMGWSFLMDELQDAYEHLGDLIKEISSDTEYGEPELRVELGHVFAHLNRAWRRRNVPEDFSDAEWEAAGEFPDDLEPVA